MIRFPRYARRRRTSSNFNKSKWGKFLASMSVKWLSSSVRNPVTVYDDVNNDLTAASVKEAGPVAFEAGGTLPTELVAGQSYFLRGIGGNDYTVHATAKDAADNLRILVLAVYNPVTNTLDVGRNFTAQGLVDMLQRGVSPTAMLHTDTANVDNVFG